MSTVQSPKSQKTKCFSGNVWSLIKEEFGRDITALHKQCVSVQGTAQILDKAWSLLKENPKEFIEFLNITDDEGKTALEKSRPKYGYSFVHHMLTQAQENPVEFFARREEFGRAFQAYQVALNDGNVGLYDTVDTFMQQVQIGSSVKDQSQLEAKR